MIDYLDDHFVQVARLLFLVHNQLVFAWTHDGRFVLKRQIVLVETHVVVFKDVLANVGAYRVAIDLRVVEVWRRVPYDDLLVHIFFYFVLPLSQLFQVLNLECSTPYLGRLLETFDAEDMLLGTNGHNPELPEDSLGLQLSGAFVDSYRLDVG